MVTLALWAFAFVLGFLVWRRRGRAALGDALRVALWRGADILPRIIVVIITAGFILQLLPSGLVARYMGPESGFVGVLLAMLVGGLFPAGGSISFSIVVVLNEAGAGLVQLVAFVTAWSVFAIHRVIAHEVPLMGLRFSLTRLAASLPLPLISAGITALILAVLP